MTLGYENVTSEPASDAKGISSSLATPQTRKQRLLHSFTHGKFSSTSVMYFYLCLVTVACRRDPLLALLSHAHIKVVQSTVTLSDQGSPSHCRIIDLIFVSH